MSEYVVTPPVEDTPNALILRFVRSINQTDKARNPRFVWESDIDMKNISQKDVISMRCHNMII